MATDDQFVRKGSPVPPKFPAEASGLSADSGATRSAFEPVLDQDQEPEPEAVKGLRNRSLTILSGSANTRAGQMPAGGATEPGVGTVLGNKYRIIAKLGAGGTATVFSAENIVTHKSVALKWLHPRSSSVPDVSARFLREAQAASRLRHPNVVDVYDLIDDAGQMFMVMELLNGETLRAYLKRVPQPKVSEFIALLLPALEGVAAAHDRGVVHRDLKPDNIFLARITDSGVVQPKVVDFGIAKLNESHALGLTRTGTTLGTPLYMSLEQLRGDNEIDGRTDVYAFGVMLYEALSGRRPYDALTLSELAIKVATTPAPPLKSVAPQIPTALAHVIDWAIAKQPADRLPSVRALIRELEPFACEQGLLADMTNREMSSPRLPAYGAAVSGTSTRKTLAERPRGAFSALAPTRRWHTRSSGWRAPAALLTVGLSLAAWLGSQSGGETAEPTTRPSVAKAQSEMVERVPPVPDTPPADASRSEARVLAMRTASQAQPDTVEQTVQPSQLPAAERAPRRSKQHRVRRSAATIGPSPQPQTKSAAELLGF